MHNISIYVLRWRPFWWLSKAHVLRSIRSSWVPSYGFLCLILVFLCIVFLLSHVWDVNRACFLRLWCFVWVLATLIWASTWDFQQCGILTCVDSEEPVQPPFKPRKSKWYSVSSLTIIKYSSDKQRLWSDCAYAQADLRLCLSHKISCTGSFEIRTLLISFHT